MKIKLQGFTLVELMITLAVSSALVAGLGQILLQSKRSYQVQQGLSYIMEDGRYILEAITRETRRIGYLRNSQAKENDPATPNAVGDAATLFFSDDNVLDSSVNLNAGQSIGGNYYIVGSDGTYDVNHLIFRYQINDDSELTDEHMSPCTRFTNIAHEPPEEKSLVVSIYWHVQKDDSDVQVLYCKAKWDQVASDGAVTPIYNIPDQPLVSNVERFFVLYGIDNNNDRAADIYRRADNIITTADWLNVVNLRLYVVLHSEEKYLAYNAPTYTVEGQTVIPDAPEERRLYRVFSTTINVRNK